MLSSGLFVLPGIAFAQAGPAILLSYVLAGLFMIPTMLSKAELATAMPKSGGSYFFIERSLGPLAGTLAGLGAWLSITLKATFALVGIGALGTLLMPGAGEWTVKVIAMSACVYFAVVNVLSVKGTGRLQVGLVLGLLAIMALYVVAGFGSAQLTRYHPFMPSGNQWIGPGNFDSKFDFLIFCYYFISTFVLGQESCNHNTIAISHNLEILRNHF